MFGLTTAPELRRNGLQWFNVERPLALADLRGRLTILDFWTICCVNCVHVQPTLRRIEETFAAEVAVIGVHSPKFPAEREPGAVAHAIARYDIRHPVVHDRDLELWADYGVSAWPTLVFIGPDGMVLGDLPGEPDCGKLLAGIGSMVRGWRERARGRAQAPRPPANPAAAGPATKAAIDDGGGAALRYPTKIKPIARGRGRLWACADSGHHQIVVLDDQGRERHRFGRGCPGFVDLGADDSAFNCPQGLVCCERFIYVADTGNHAIRRIDLASGSVTTVAGTGARGNVLCRPTRGHDVALASVWDLALGGSRLFFANAGTHQLGEVDLASGIVRPLAGTGHEGLADGPARAAHLAQPSGLALDEAGATLYFADSETSAVRALDLARASAGDADRGSAHGPQVRTLIGEGLFAYGRANGAFAEARFQHCLGLDWWDGALIVADSYNATLRVVDLAERRVSELGEAGFDWSDGVAGCDEPSGVTVAGPGRLLVADTNHHRLVEVLVGGGSARTWAA